MTPEQIKCSFCGQAVCPNPEWCQKAADYEAEIVSETNWADQYKRERDEARAALEAAQGECERLREDYDQVLTTWAEARAELTRLRAENAALKADRLDRIKILEDAGIGICEGCVVQPELEELRAFREALDEADWKLLTMDPGPLADFVYPREVRAKLAKALEG